MGPSYTVPANTVGTGTAYHLEITYNGTAAAAGTGTLALYWGGVAGVALITTGSVISQSAGATLYAQADLYWESISAVSAVMSWGTVQPAGNTQSLFVSTGSVVTGLTTTSNKALTFGWTWSHAGSGTVVPMASYANQVH